MGLDTQHAKPPPGTRLSVRVECVTRTDRVSPHHRIRAIGGRGRDGMDWRLSEESAIAAIDNERATFYLEWPQGSRLDIVAGQGLGKRYLKAESDGESPDRLLALPDCG
jgi:hypothetical protein